MDNKLSTEGKWSDLHVEYDDTQRSYILYAHLNGHEMPGVNVTASEYNDVKNGRLTLEQLADMAYLDWMKEHALTTEPSETQNRQEGRNPMDDNQMDIDEETVKGPSVGGRARDASVGLLRNALYQSAKLLAWAVDMGLMLIRLDGKGLRQALRDANHAVTGVMQGITAAIGLERGVDRIREYLKSLYKGGGELLRGDVRQTRDTVRPIVDDLADVADVTLVQTGIGQMARNAVGRVPDGFSAAEQAIKGNRDQAGQQVRKMAGETLNDVKTVLHSSPVQKAVDRLVTGMEKVERATRLDDKQQREQNMQQQSEAHPRLSAIAVYSHSLLPRHYIRCKIDGIQQMGRAIRETDYFDFEVGAKSRIELAEKYYADELSQSASQTQERTASMTR